MYYEHSGKFPPHGPILAIGISLVAAVVLSWVYAYLVLYIPLAGYVTFLLTGGFGAGIGVACSFAARTAQIRNDNLVRGMTAFVAALGLWSSWAAWTYAFLQRADERLEGVDPTFFYLHPSLLVKFIQIINEHGAWNLSGGTPTGIVLWLIWAVEAGVVLVVPMLLALSRLDDPFCEGCTVWCARRPALTRIPATAIGLIPKKAEGRQWDELLGPVHSQNHCRMDLHACPSCKETNALTITHVVVGVDSKGNPTTTETRIVDKLVLTSTEVTALEQAIRPSSS